MKMGKNVFKNALAESITGIRPNVPLRKGEYYGVPYTVMKSTDGTYYATVQAYGFPEAKGIRSEGEAEKKIIRLIRKENQKRDPRMEFLL